jgi:hypothetical protein
MSVKARSLQLVLGWTLAPQKGSVSKLFMKKNGRRISPAAVVSRGLGS